MSSTAIDKKRGRWAVEVALGVVLIASTVPILWIVLLAFLPNRAIVNSNWDFPFWLGNFEKVFTDGVFPQQVLNSIAIVLGAVAICLVLGGLGGYGIAKLRPPRWILLPSLLLAAFIPIVPAATLIPGFYVMLTSMGLIGTIPGLILLNALLNAPFAVLLMASYFGSVPEELREAALVDGAGEMRTFLSIILPLVRPGLASVAIFVAIMAWNEFLLALTMTSGGASSPLTVGIASLLEPDSVRWGQLAAVGTIAVIPIVILAIFANRQIVAGLTAGAVKG